MRLRGHLWTLWPLFRAVTRPPRQPAGEPWRERVPDDAMGTVELTGLLRRPDGARDLLILLHGLGGSATSRYLPPAVRCADRCGLATLRLNLRGSDLEGQDIYHAGLSCDLASTLASEQLADFERIYVFGYSLGGHIALRYATEVEDPRLRAVAAVCTPLDMERAQRNFDRRSCGLYRRYILHSLKQIYASVAARRPVPHPPQVVSRITTIREFDACTVVPRFGFRSPEDYYRKVSVGPLLGGLRVPSLLVEVDGDPMVPLDTVRPWLAGASPQLDVRFVRRGGHVGFPADLDLGFDAPPGIENQLIHWLLRYRDG